MLLNSSEAKVLKSKPRPRFVPPAASVPPLADIASIPFRRTRVNSGDRPRTEMVRPSPASREMATPGIRWMDSARFRSGKSAMSSARIASTAPMASRLSLNARLRLSRKPVTTTSSSESVFCGWASCACAEIATMDIEARPRTARTEPRSGPCLRSNAGMCLSPNRYYEREPACLPCSINSRAPRTAPVPGACKRSDFHPMTPVAFCPVQNDTGDNRRLSERRASRQDLSAEFATGGDKACRGDFLPLQAGSWDGSPRGAEIPVEHVI